MFCEIGGKVERETENRKNIKGELRVGSKHRNYYNQFNVMQTCCIFIRVYVLYINEKFAITIK